MTDPAPSRWEMTITAEAEVIPGPDRPAPETPERDVPGDNEEEVTP